MKKAMLYALVAVMGFLAPFMVAYWYTIWYTIAPWAPVLCVMVIVTYFMLINRYA